MTFLLRLAFGAFALSVRLVFLAAQTPVSPPWSTTSVTAVGAAWRSVKTPPKKKAACTWPSSPIVITCAIPFVVSIGTPSGSCSPSLSGSPFTSTVPATGITFALTPPAGGGSVGPGAGGSGAGAEELAVPVGLELSTISAEPPEGAVVTSAETADPAENRGPDAVGVTIIVTV